MVVHTNLLKLFLFPLAFSCTLLHANRDEVRIFEQALKTYLERPSTRAAQEVVEAYDALKAKPENQHYASTSYAKASWKGHPIDFLREISELTKERDQARTALQDEQDKNKAEYDKLRSEYDKLSAEYNKEHEINIGLSQRLEALSQKVCIALDEKKFAKLSYETQKMYSSLSGKATAAYLAKVDKEQLHQELAPALQMLARNETMITDVACAFDPVNKLNRQTTRLETLVRKIEKQHAKLQGHARRAKELSQKLEEERETRKSLEQKLEQQVEEQTKLQEQLNAKKIEREKASDTETIEENPLQNPEQTPSVENTDNNEE